MDRALPLALLAATIAFVLAWSARAPAATAHAWTPDELGHLVSGGFLDQLRDPETAVNPPLFRWMTAHLPTAADRVAAGRSLALVGSGVGAGLIALVGWLATGRRAYGLLAALPFALLAEPVRATAEARVYGLWAGVAAAWMLALHLWVDRPDDRRRAAAVAILAVPLPWLHHLSGPWLLLVGLGLAATVPAARRLPLLLAPAALASLPLAHAVLTRPERQAPSTEPWAVTVDRVLGLGVPEPTLPGGLSLVAATVAAALLVGGGFGRRLPPPARVAWWCAAGLIVAALLAAPWQRPRYPTTAMAALVAGPLLVALPARLPPRGAAAALLGIGLLVGLPGLNQVRHPATRPTLSTDAVPHVARWFAEAPPGDVAIVPFGYTAPFAVYLTGHLPADLPRDPRCEGWQDCFVAQDRRVLARHHPPPDKATWVVVFDRRPQGPEGCEPVRLEVVGAGVWRCGG